MARRKNKTSSNRKTQSKGKPNFEPQGGSPTKEEAVSDAVKDAERASNDPEWYAADPRLASDAANVPFNIPFGQPLDLFDGKTSFTTSSGKKKSTYDLIWDDTSNAALTGMCNIRIKPSIGLSMDRLSPVNTAANALYTHVRYVNSGRKNYDPCDLMLYTLTMADVLSFIEWCHRLYNYAFMYSQSNKYIHYAAIEGNGVSPDSLTTNLANFRYWINSYINKVASFVVPADINIFRRKAFMYSSIYIENQYGNLKDQLYQFVPDGFYKFDLDQRKAGCLKYAPLDGFFEGAGPGNKPGNTDDSGLITVSGLIAYGEYLISNITGDEDFGLMSGDILKAYPNSVLGLSSIPEEGGILPIYMPYVLSQIQNSTIMGDLNTDGESPTRLKLKYLSDTTGNYEMYAGDIHQDLDGNLICVECAGSSESAIMASANKILTTENPNPGVADVLEGTRLMVNVSDRVATVAGATDKVYALNAGTEIVTGVSYSTYNTKGDLITVYDSSNMVSTTGKEKIPRHFQFKYYPMKFDVVFTLNDPKKVTHMNVVSNVDNCAMIDSYTLARIHEAALLSLFYVPGVSKVINSK